MTTSRLALPGQLTVEDAPDIDPLLVFAAATHERRFYWEVPETGRCVVGLGTLHTVEPDPGPGRFVDAAAAVEGLVASGLPDEAVIVGGFSFDDRIQPSSAWASYGTGRLVVPELAMVVDGDRSHVVRAPHAHLPTPAAEAVLHRAQEVAVPVLDVDDAYLAMVEAAVERIHAGGLAKVVCARAVRLDGAVAVPALLHELRARYPGCAVFAVAEGDRVFCGATPEVLIARHGADVATAAVAGTRPRGADDAADTALAAALLTDPKELAEHAFVTDEIRRILLDAGVELDPSASTEVVRLRHVQHLRTPVRGRVRPGGPSLIELAGRLHPTPAVAGTPTAEARAFLSEWEAFDRGWYASPIGWTDAAGNGEVRVALRSGLVDDAGITLFAGAGVVDGSDPRRELDETTSKLRALVTPLTLG